MTIKKILRATALSNYGRSIREAPREIVVNKHLLFSALIYAMGAIPASMYIHLFCRSSANVFIKHGTKAQLL